MPYRPYATTEVDRNYAYKVAWAGAGCSVISLALYLLGIDGIVNAWVFGGTVGGLLAATFNRRVDDYYLSLCSTGERWVMVALGLYMIVGWFVWTADIASPAGLGFLAPDAAAPSGLAPSVLIDGMLVAHVLAVVFYAGYTFRWLRDRVDANDDDL